MTPERQQQIQRICQDALDRSGPARSEYLSSVCQDDEDLRREVESLLEYERAAEDFIEGTAIERVARELAANLSPQAGTRIGAYEVVSALGSGGMGEVYRARDTKLRRDVAIKVLPKLFNSDPRRRARFEHEAQMLAALNHPHIAAIYGIDESSGVPRSSSSSSRATPSRIYWLGPCADAALAFRCRRRSKSRRRLLMRSRRRTKRASSTGT